MKEQADESGLVLRIGAAENITWHFNQKKEIP